MTTDAAPAAPDSGAPELSIVMPCLNEAKTLGICIGKAQAWLAENSVSGEIVIGDNGSTDGSQQIATDLGARVIDVPVRGYGAALWHASGECRGRYIIMGDSDDSYDFSALDPFLEKLREGYDLVMGNRFRGGIQPGAMPWKNRYLGNPVLTAIGRLLFPSPARDFHCGLRGFSADAFRRMDLHTTGMEYASEMVIKASLLNMRIAEVPTTLSKDGRDRPPHLRPWRDGWRHLRFMLMYSPRWLFLIPGLLLTALGGTLMLLVLPGPFNIGGPAMDVASLLYSGLMVIVGTQLIGFHYVARRIAMRLGIHPPPPGNAAQKPPRVEPVLLLGLLLLLLGVAGAVWTVFIWAQAGFGHLDHAEILRKAIPSAVLIAIGVQTMMVAFLRGMVGLGVRS